MKTKIKKTFIDVNEEEKWLNQQGEKGLMMIGYDNGVYEFEDVSPAKYQYKIDLPNYTGAKRKDYLEFLEDSGISVVAQYTGRVYLRKNTTHGPLEIYTDKLDIYRQSKKKYSHFFVLSITQFSLGLFMLFQMKSSLTVGTVPYGIVLFFGTVFIIVGVVMFMVTVSRYTKNTPAKENTDLWQWGNCSIKINCQNENEIVLLIISFLYFHY